MTASTRKLLVTTALPYANGALHLGHLLEHIQSDIWVRTQKLLGRDCIFVCGDDAHGTPVMLKAQSLNINVETFIKQCYEEHVNDLQDFNIQYDNFYTTHSTENKELASDIYVKLEKNGDIAKRTIQQAFDEVKQMFLPDRFIKGSCPKCNAPEQYGDSCEACGASYSPTDLKDAVSVLSNTSPIQKESEHYFFCLEHYQEFLQQWISAGHLQVEVARKLQEWFVAGFEQWDISRDGPYFGFEIPGTVNKYFYVWLDAPIGYIASFKNHCNKNPQLHFDEYWQAESSTELYHFIGKDIIYFHALFWPAILKGANYRLPTKIFAHGFLTVNGQKMSKSRGTFISARTYLNHFSADLLRYYFAAKLNPTIEDIDLNLEDFVARINSDLVGKLINIASRLAGFITKQFNSTLSANCHNLHLYQDFVQQKDGLAELLINREYSRAIREIMLLADKANAYIDSHKPWNMMKEPTAHSEAHEVCSLGINLFRVLMTYLQPILPTLSKEVITFLNVADLSWEAIASPLKNHAIRLFKPLLQRIDLTQVNAMIDNAKENSQPIPTAAPAPTAITQAKPQLTEFISIEDFMKVDLRLAKIINAVAVPEADKLIQLTLSLNPEGTDTRQVFAGIKEAYTPEELIGKLTVIVANLAPRKMRFGLSEGMVLAAGPGGKELWLLEPDTGAMPGMKVK